LNAEYNPVSKIYYSRFARREEKNMMKLREKKGKMNKFTFLIISAP
jgi:hypothetical protein